MRYALITLLAACTASCTTGSKPPETAPSAMITAPGPVISRIAYRRQTIVVRAGGDHGPTYSLETTAGEVLVGDMTLDELAMKRPDLFHRIKSAEASAWAGL